MTSKPSQNKATVATPICRAILLCDDVIRDETTHKSSVIGIFDTFRLTSLPGATRPCKIFLLLANGVGKHSITAEVQDTKQGVVLFRSPGEGQIGAPGKAAAGELVLPVGALMFDRAGAYEMVVFANKAEVGRASFNVKP